MKTYKLRSIFVVANVLVGIIMLSLMGGGIRVFGGTTVPWLTIFIGGVCASVLIAVNLILLSVWVLTPLKRILATMESFGQQDAAPPSIPTRIAELQKLSELLQTHTQYMRDLVHTGERVLDKGLHEEMTLDVTSNILGRTFLRYVYTLEAVDNHVEEIIRGYLFSDIPEELQGTKLGDSLRGMTTELRTIIARIRKEAKSISALSAQIAGMAQQGSRNANTETQEIESISSSIHQVAQNLREVMHDITLQNDSLEKTFADIKDMLASTEQIHSNIELLSASAEATSRSISQIHEFMQEIEGHAHSLSGISETVSKEAKDGGQAVEAVIDGIQTIKTTVENAATAIRRLGDESERIGEILEVINGVAEQTNLLALNASIIAAQAGEHGRGFAVVAGEIKELADRTRTSTQEIGGIIRSLQTEVEHGMIAMKRCLEAVSEGVELANRSGAILTKIVQSIQGAREMASTLAQATVTQTENSQQVHAATEQITQKIEELYATASKQAKDSTHLAEMANILQNVTQHVDQSAMSQLQQTDAIVRSIEEIQNMVKRNANIAYQLAASSEELGGLESDLAENMGHFLVAKPPLPAEFNQGLPTIVFIYPGAPFFYSDVYQGIQELSTAKHFQALALDSQNDPVLQAEYVNWLIRQPWLKGLILTPFDEQTGGRIVLDTLKYKIPVVVVDRPALHAYISVFSDNRQGGEYAAEMLREKLPGTTTVFACGPRNITTIFNRMDGFFKKAKTYNWQVAELFTAIMDITQTKQSILEGLKVNPLAEGIFLTNEHASLSFIELVREGSIPKGKLYGISYDINAEIAEAIADGSLLGTIFQDPPQLGRVATQELYKLLQQPYPKTPPPPREVLVPVRKISKENLPSQWLHPRKKTKTAL